MDRGMQRDWDKAVQAYPDPAIERIDPSFSAYVLGNAALERLHTGSRWTEGPVWFGDSRMLVWSDIPNNRMLRWMEESGEVSVFRSPSAYSNGNTRDRLGRLLSCEHGSRALSRTEMDGRISILVASYQNKRLNAPNDLVVHPDGSVWFSDPGYGILANYEGDKAEPELPAAVYRLDPGTGQIDMLISDLEKPNGLCFSPDYSRLYVSDTGCTHKEGHPRRIYVYEVLDEKRLSKAEVFCDLGKSMADGIRCDIDGNLWSSSGWGPAEDNGVQVYSPAGKLIGKIHLPEPASNLCFGGRKRNRLFITAGQSLYSLFVDAQGAEYPFCEGD